MFSALGMYKLVKPIESDGKILLGLFIFQFEMFQFLRNFLQRNQSDSLPKSRGAFRATKNFYKKATPSLDRTYENTDTSIILKTRIILLQISFRFQQFFAQKPVPPNPILGHSNHNEISYRYQEW